MSMYQENWRKTKIVKNFKIKCIRKKQIKSNENIKEKCHLENISVWRQLGKTWRPGIIIRKFKLWQR